MPPRTIPEILAAKGRERIAALTAYDYQVASMLDEAGIDILLVGDSVGNVIYGLPTTLGVTMEMMIRHTSAVSRAARKSLVVADLPFGSYQPSSEMAVTNAVRLIAEGGAQAVKLEGGRVMAETVRRMVDVGIPVMGHVGLTPQSYHQLGGYRMRGKTEEEAEGIREDARAIEKAGAFSVVLECVEPSLAAEITRSIAIPTIGIGSGPHCDGEVLVTHDLLGLTVSHVPKFVEPLADLRSAVSEAAAAYLRRVKEPKR
jgi:3-methyl-2-oxobutanoate hydroxymethyltransferase